MKTNSVIKAITGRRSIKKYTPDPISETDIQTILEAGRWAPSGLNNQPWSFVIIRSGEYKNRLSRLTTYGRIIRNCCACICVFYNLPEGYNRDKDVMSIGACVQNMLLAAHSLGIGSVWLGEILKSKTEANSLMDIDENNELMSVIALGFPDEAPRGRRKKIETLILKELV